MRIKCYTCGEETKISIIISLISVTIGVAIATISGNQKILNEVGMCKKCVKAHKRAWTIKNILEKRKEEDKLRNIELERKSEFENVKKNRTLYFLEMIK